MSEDTQAAEGATQDQEPINPDAYKKAVERAQKLEGQLKDIEKKYSTFSSMYKDIDPDEARQLKEEKLKLEKELASKDPAKQQELHARELGKFKEEYEGKLKSVTEELEKTRKLNKELAVTDRVLSKIGKLFTDDSQKLIKRVVQERCDLDDDGTIVVKDESGEVMYKGARPMTPEEFGEELVKEFPSLARSTATPGGKDATPGEKRSSRFKVPETWDEWQAMPNAQAVWNQLSHEERRKIAKTKRFGA